MLLRLGFVKSKRQDNFKVLMDAFALVIRHFPTFKFVCAEGRDFNESEHARFRAMNADNSIIHVTPSEEEIVWLIQNATCLFYPSLTDTLASFVLDARHSGCALILSDTASNHELDGENAMYFSPSSPSELAGRMEDMILNWEEYSEEDKKIPSWSDAAAKIMQFYESLLCR